MDNFPLPLHFKYPHSTALDAWNSECPLSLKLSIMSLATRSHFPFGLYVWVPYHFFSDPGPRNDQCPCASLCAQSATIWEFATHISSCPFSHRTMSLYIGMKIVLPVSCSGSLCISVIIFWISVRICNEVNPGKIFHSNSIGSPSIRSNARFWDEFINRSIFSFHEIARVLGILSMRNTDSENT